MHAVEVLLVEDNAGDALLIRQVINECSVPVNIHHAVDGEQALLMLTNPYFTLNLIILDLNIPKIAGASLARRWDIGDIPVVVFTTYGSDQRELIASGVREVIQKPTDLVDFRNEVYGIVQRWILPLAPGIAVGGEFTP